MADVKTNEIELRNEILHHLLINNADHQLNDLNSIMNFATRHNILQYPHKTASKHYNKVKYLLKPKHWIFHLNFAFLVLSLISILI